LGKLFTPICLSHQAV